MTRTLWFSYSLPPDMSLDGLQPINSPYTITYYLGRFLRDRARERGWQFEYRNLDSSEQDNIGEDDIVIGHSWYPDGWLNRALHSPARFKFVLQPYQKDIVAPTESEWVKSLFARPDHLFLITGSYWWDTMGQGLYGDWKAKSTRVDMAVHPDAHPYLKRKWNRKGKRGFLCVGADIPYKGLDLVAELAQTAGVRLGYFGSAPKEKFQHVPQFRHMGGATFTPDLIQWVCDEYDFFISLARGDANPTTLLETACWGLIGFCNQESGYHPNVPFLELRLNDMAFNWEQLELWQQKDEDELQSRSLTMRQQIAEQYTWTKFATTVWNKMAEVMSSQIVLSERNSSVIQENTECLSTPPHPYGTLPNSDLKVLLLESSSSPADTFSAAS